MALKTRLLATAAIPLIALIGLGPVSASAATLVRPDAPVHSDTLLLQVQSDDDAELLKKKRQELQERRQKREDLQKRRDERKKAQQDDKAGGGDVNSDQVKPRRKKQDAETQIQQDDTDQVKPRRKKQDDAGNNEQRQDNADTVRPRKDRKNSDVIEQNDADTKDKANVRKNQDTVGQQDDATPRKRRDADNPERVKRRKDIAADPSKTTDTIDLPVENGAAVLDSDKDADKRGAADNSVRERRKRQREEVKPVRVPRSDRDAQAEGRDSKPVRIRPVMEEKGERVTGFKGYDDVGGRRVGRDADKRFIINIDGRIVVRGDDDTRVARRTETRYDKLSNGRIRETVIRPNGDKVVTIRNRYGEIIRRSRLTSSGRETVIVYSPELESGRERLFLHDPGAELPPMRLQIPVRDYIIDVSTDRDRNYEQFLDQPPVEPVERVYSIDEVKYSARIRDKMRRIDLDTITFDTGSAQISMDQASSLRQVAGAIKDILDKDPGETFMIEGHTDAVGSDESNLVLSDGRAASVAEVLTSMFDIPAENLVTQGYGERFLKIDTDTAERQNRRVTIRRITPLVRPMASAE